MQKIGSRRLEERAELPDSKRRRVAAKDALRGFDTDAFVVDQLAAQIGRVGDKTDAREANAEIERVWPPVTDAPKTAIEVATTVATKFRLRCVISMSRDSPSTLTSSPAMSPLAAAASAPRAARAIAFPPKSQSFGLSLTCPARSAPRRAATARRGDARVPDASVAGGSSRRVLGCFHCKRDFIAVPAALPRVAARAPRPLNRPADSLLPGLRFAAHRAFLPRERCDA